MMLIIKFRKIHDGITPLGTKLFAGENVNCKERQSAERSLNTHPN